MNTTMTNGFKKTTKQTRYDGKAKHLRFNIKLQRDYHVVALANFVGKEIGVSPQTTAREAMSRGLILIAEESDIDLSKVVLTEDGSVNELHGRSSYHGENKCQEKLVS
jgi:hypothetical protein